MGSMMASFAEGLALAEGSGLQLEDFIEAVGLGAIAAPMFALKVCAPLRVLAAFAIPQPLTAPPFPPGLHPLPKCKCGGVLCKASVHLRPQSVGDFSSSLCARKWPSKAKNCDDLWLQSRGASGRLRHPNPCAQGPSMAKGRYVSAFPLKHQQKDLRLVLELAQELGQHLPVAAASNESYLEVPAPCIPRPDCSSPL